MDLDYKFYCNWAKTVSHYYRQERPAAVAAVCAIIKKYKRDQHVLNLCLQSESAFI